MKTPSSILSLLLLAGGASAFAPRSITKKTTTSVRKAPVFTSLAAASDSGELRAVAEPKVILKAPELPRDEDGLARIPVLPFAIGFLAVIGSTTIKMRENRAKKAAKQEAEGK